MATTEKGITATAVAALNVETPEEEVRYRKALTKRGTPVMKDGEPLMLAYVTARYVQDVLDEVVGPANWQTTFTVLPGGSVECALSVRVEGDWITKRDVGVPSTIEPEKGAFSDAFKRAAVHWGIARDLYDERDADPSQEPVEERPAAQPQGSIQHRVRGGATNVTPMRSRGQRQRPEVDIESYDLDNAPWECPVHGDVKIVPGGISKRTNKPYSPFLACPVAGCDERGPFLND